jgi:hypothetical protein
MYYSLSAGLFGDVVQFKFEGLPIRTIEERFLYRVYQLCHCLSGQCNNSVPPDKNAERSLK